MARDTKPFFCAHCGHTGPRPAGNLCPKCGKNASPIKGPMLSAKIVGIIAAISCPIVFFVYLFMTNEQILNEMRYIRQPRQNSFFIGIDVSATIETDIIEKLKTSLTERLRVFVGDEAVSYGVMTFGNAGCGEQSFLEITSGPAPQDMMTFGWRVEDPLSRIKTAVISPRDTKPLTTPLYCLLETILPRQEGSRIIIFSDLMNDDSDCPTQFDFPEEALTDFGKNPKGQIIFLYPTPPMASENAQLNQSLLAKQQSFIDQMNALGHAGKLRVFFFHIPDDPLDRLDFLESQFQTAIPATTFEIVKERTYRVMQTIVSAVRG